MDKESLQKYEQRLITGPIDHELEQINHWTNRYFYIGKASTRKNINLLMIGDDDDFARELLSVYNRLSGLKKLCNKHNISKDYFIQKQTKKISALKQEAEERLLIYWDRVMYGKSVEIRQNFINYYGRYYKSIKLLEVIE
ncbi:MAG: hypothetical protein N4A74_20625 [Carboxylicivirga sp.]|jgi:hypothetical protein|nr:hypothetical protein [Carboxylicivirga sp.]